MFQVIVNWLNQVDGQLQEVNAQLQVISARTENIRILSHNHHYAIPSGYEPLLKTVGLEPLHPVFF